MSRSMIRIKLSSNQRKQCDRLMNGMYKGLEKQTNNTLKVLFISELCDADEIVSNLQMNVSEIYFSAVHQLDRNAIKLSLIDQTVHAIILDSRSEGSDLRDFLNEYRLSHPFIPVLLFVAKFRKYLPDGFDDFIYAGQSPEVVSRAILYSLERRQQLMQLQERCLKKGITSGIKKFKLIWGVSKGSMLQENY